MKYATYRTGRFQGAFRAPGDKSLTHRAYLFGAIANGVSRIRKPLRGEDCESTLSCVGQLGLRVEWVSGDEVLLYPPQEWQQPESDLDCGNSGTTMRLISGLLASRPLVTRLIGDSSLSRRPMGRIAQPLRKMGAVIDGDTPPLTIHGSDALEGITHQSPVASAQVKSCLLLAGLRAGGLTTVREPSISRDHTERMLKAMGAPLISRGGGMPDTSHMHAAIAVDTAHEVSISAADSLQPFEFAVPGDISSAAFFLVAAAAIPGSHLVLSELSVNPTRTGILDVLEDCGLMVKLENLRDELGEPVADAELRGTGELRPFEIAGPLVPRLIDEIPVLAVLATQCDGVTHIRDAAEMRVKECDRIEVMAEGLRRMGASIETHPDGMTITGPTPLKGTSVEAHLDHRIAMSFAVAGLLADGETVIEGAESIATSFPGFQGELERLSLGA